MARQDPGRGRWLLSGARGALMVLGGTWVGEGVAHACDPVADVLVGDGLGGPEVTHVPRNHAYVLAAPGRVLIAGSPLPLYRTATLLAPGPLHEPYRDLEVDDVVDTVAPSRPLLRAATLDVHAPDGSCFDTTTQTLTLRLDADPTDDHTPARSLTYAIFGGDTKAAAETAATPVDMRVGEVAARVFIHHSAPSARWFSVAGIDLAGNVSSRSDAVEVEVHEEGGGCTVSRPSGPAGGAGNSAALALAVAALVYRRRHTRLDSTPCRDVLSRS